MINHGTVESIEKPEELVIDDHSVWVVSGITETIEGGETQKGYSYTLIQYTKDEYIKATSDANKDLEEQVLETQTSLACIYEQILTAVAAE